MAFADYLDLRTAVVETVGDVGIVDVFDRLTLLAESKLNRRLRTRFQIASEPVTVSGATLILPADFAEFIGLYRGDRMMTWRPGDVAPSGSYTLRYYQKLPTLTIALPASNWLLEVYPDVYLYAVGAEAARHLRNVEMATALAAGLEEAMRSVYADDESARYAGARIRIAGPTP